MTFMTKPAPLLEMPDWQSLAPTRALERLRHVQAESRKEIEAVLSAKPYTYEGTLVPVFEARERASLAAMPIFHLNYVLQDSGWRPIHDEALPERIAFESGLDQDPRLREALLEVAKPASFQSLSPVRQKVVTDALRDLKLSGSELDGPGKERFTAIQTRLGKLGSDFNNHVLDDTKDWRLWLQGGADTEGLPADFLAMAEQKAKETPEADRKGRYAVTLEAPFMIPFMKSSGRRDLRETLHRAYGTRATRGNRDNAPLIAEILKLRQEMADLLGYRNFAEVSLASKMAGNPERVRAFLSDLKEKGRAKAVSDIQELEDFARAQGAPMPLMRWDTAYWSERLKQSKFRLDDETLRPYFPLEKVRSGLFETVKRLYGVTVVPSATPLWHPDARLFDVVDGSGKTIARLTMDLIARNGKRSGAWMDDVVGLKRTAAGVQIPIAHLVCNFSPATADRPTCLNHDEVTTLFHEMGHVLHHLLTEIEEYPASGIRGTPWDGVELPSQLFESWAWAEEAMPLISGHLKTGAPLPADLLKNLRDSRTFQSGLMLFRQLEFSSLDMELHVEDWNLSTRTHRAIIEEVQGEYELMPPVPESRTENAFLHIFPGGYAAGYYSYKWAEVLAADAFSYFEEKGIFSRKAGDHWRKSLLSQGGGRDFMQCYRDFRGREPSLDALLRSEGLLPK